MSYNPNSGRLGGIPLTPPTGADDHTVLCYHVTGPELKFINFEGDLAGGHHAKVNFVRFRRATLTVPIGLANTYYTQVVADANVTAASRVICQQATTDLTSIFDVRAVPGNGQLTFVVRRGVGALSGTITVDYLLGGAP